MKEDSSHFRCCCCCGKRYNAFERGNYFYCSFGCSHDRIIELKPKDEEDDTVY